MTGLLENKIALVTGAANGIGRGAVLRLAEEGADVIISDIDDQRGAELVGEVEALGRNARFIHTDMASVKSIQDMVAQAISAFGRIDLLSNNAGITRVQKFLDVTEEAWDLQHDVNAKGAFFCLQAVARHMIERKQGRIVNTASIAALGYRETTSIAYSASKAAVLIMTQVSAHLLKDHGIRVNAVCPGPTYTDFVLGGVDDQRRAKVTHETMYSRMDERVPIGRANTPEDVANVIVFLMSDLARNVNGSAYAVDGGIMLR